MDDDDVLLDDELLCASGTSQMEAVLGIPSAVVSCDDKLEEIEDDLDFDDEFLEKATAEISQHLSCSNGVVLEERGDQLQKSEINKIVSPKLGGISLSLDAFVEANIEYPVHDTKAFFKTKEDCAQPARGILTQLAFPQEENYRNHKRTTESMKEESMCVGLPGPASRSRGLGSRVGQGSQCISDVDLPMSPALMEDAINIVGSSSVTLGEAWARRPQFWSEPAWLSALLALDLPIDTYHMGMGRSPESKVVNSPFKLDLTGGNCLKDVVRSGRAGASFSVPFLLVLLVRPYDGERTFVAADISGEVVLSLSEEMIEEWEQVCSALLKKSTRKCRIGVGCVLALRDAVVLSGPLVLATLPSVVHVFSPLVGLSAEESDEVSSRFRGSLEAQRTGSLQGLLNHIQGRSGEGG